MMAIMVMAAVGLEMMAVVVVVLVTADLLRCCSDGGRHDSHDS